MLVPQSFVRAAFEQAMGYEQFVAMGHALGHRNNWDMRYGQLELDEAQREQVGQFTRRMHVLCLSGTWCGDCALQGAAMQRVAEAAPGKIDLRFVQRDESMAELVVKSQINAGFRVPITWWMAEDYEVVHSFGDRTLSRYRSMARKDHRTSSLVKTQAPEDPVREVLREVVEMFERVHHLLRLSGRLREKHGD